jgi:predicted RNA binding protein YcfA (HicA-like mRNA interferase family)
VRYKDVLRHLGRAGYVKKRQKGSHATYEGPNGEKVTVAGHGSKTIAPGTLRDMQRRTGMDFQA